jgi:hypothetical protein
MDMTQTNEVLKHLKAHGKITSMEAITLFGATRLSDIIMRLRKHYIIETEMVESPVPNRYGKKSRYGIYHYKGERYNTTDYYWHYFEDGYRVCARGFSDLELAVEEKKHGKLVRRIKDESLS